MGVVGCDARRCLLVLLGCCCCVNRMICVDLWFRAVVGFAVPFSVVLRILWLVLRCCFQTVVRDEKEESSLVVVRVLRGLAVLDLLASSSVGSCWAAAAAVGGGGSSLSSPMAQGMGQRWVHRLVT